MPSLTETLILVLYFFVLSILAIYGWHRYYLVYLYMKNREKVPPALPAPPDAELPQVTIQLPIYNEMYVADRLIDARESEVFVRALAQELKEALVGCLRRRRAGPHLIEQAP